VFAPGDASAPPDIPSTPDVANVPDVAADVTETVDTAPPPDTGLPWFFTVHAAEVDYDLERAAQAFGAILDLGGTGVRTDIFWWDIEPDDGAWSQDRIDFYTDYVALAQSKGLQVMVIVSGAPGWATALYQSDAEAFWLRYDQYVTKALTPVAANLKHVQLWNEPNHVIDPIAAEDDWRLFTQGAAIARKLAPGVTTYANVMGNLAGWQDAVADWLAKADDAIDVIGFDHYPGTWACCSNTDWAPLDEFVTLLNGHPGAVIETGFSSWAAVVADQESQRDWINASLPVLRDRISAAGDAIVLAGYYQLIDVDTDGVGQESHFGIMHTDLTPKLGYDALKTQLTTYDW